MRNLNVGTKIIEMGCITSISVEGERNKENVINPTDYRKEDRSLRKAAYLESSK